MNESKFEELVNLYFDREISAAELARLKKELADNEDRRNAFQMRYQLHKATCVALSSESDERVATASVSDRYRIRHSSFLGFGIAACLLFVFATSLLVTRDSADDVERYTVEARDLSGRALYSENQEPETQSQGSLSSQLRLAGLTPEITPANQSFSRVDAEALRQREARLQDAIEQIDRYKVYSAMPEPQLIRSLERTYSTSSSSSNWPTGFKSSLASFR